MSERKNYRVKVDKLGHFMGTQFPKGTIVSGIPYPADPRYLEVTMPDGHILTVDEGYEVEAVE